MRFLDQFQHRNENLWNVCDDIQYWVVGQNKTLNANLIANSALIHPKIGRLRCVSNYVTLIVFYDIGQSDDRLEFFQVNYVVVVLEDMKAELLTAFS